MFELLLFVGFVALLTVLVWTAYHLGVEDGWEDATDVDDLVTRLRAIAYKPEEANVEDRPATRTGENEALTSASLDWRPPYERL